MTEEELNETLRKAREDLAEVNKKEEEMGKPSPLKDIIKFFAIVLVFLAGIGGLGLLGYSIYKSMNKPAVEQVIEPVPTPEPQEKEREYKRPFGDINN